MASFFKGNTLYREDSNGNYLKVNDIIPTHHWKLQEESGTNVNDCGNEPATLSNTDSTVNQVGKINKAYGFNGTSSRLTFAQTLKSSSNGTICAWIKPDSITSDVRAIVTESDGGTNNYLRFYTFGGKLRFNLRDSGVFIGSVETPEILNDIEWYHVAVVARDSEYELYINGVSQTLSGIDGTLENTGNWVDSVTVTEGYIGAFNATSSVFDGLIEDVRYYDYDLSDQEISTIYNAGDGTLDQGLIKSYPTSKDPVNHWKLQEETGTDVNDSFCSNTLTNNNATINQTGVNGIKSYSFNGTSSYLDANGLPASMNTTQGSFSLWVNFENVIAFELPFGIGDKDANTRLALRRQDSTNNLRLFFLQEASYNWDIEASNAIDNNTWMYITITHDGVSPKLYKNGVDITNFTNSTDLSAWITSASGFDSFKIGAYDYNNIVNDNYFSGKIADFRYYDYAISEQEIKNIYNLGKGLLL